MTNDATTKPGHPALTFAMHPLEESLFVGTEGTGFHRRFFEFAAGHKVQNDALPIEFVLGQNHALHAGLGRSAS